MMPVLVDFGVIKIYTMSVFVVLAFLWAGFVVSKKAREYHLGEVEIYDGGVISLITIWVFDKLLVYFSLQNLSLLGLWAAVLIGAVIVAKRENANLFTVFDLFSMGLMMALAWWSLGLFWSGTPVGRQRFVPVELLSGVMYLMGFIFLWLVEGKYRTFPWYRGRRSSANTGFLFGSALTIFGIVVMTGELMSKVVTRERLFLSVLGMVMGVFVIYLRSERVLKQDLRAMVDKVRWR